ncbi:MAG: DNA-3-methyladenine glycosylase I [Promethearchaeota archaeon]
MNEGGWSPPKKPKNDQEYFEALIRSVFSAGFSYKVIKTKWEGFREIFHNFNPYKIAQWTESDILIAIESPKIVRNVKKIRATVENAKNFIDLVKRYGTFENYLKSLRDKPYNEISQIISKTFKWLGPSGTYFFLWRSNEKVPSWEELRHK